MGKMRNKIKIEARLVRSGFEDAWALMMAEADLFDPEIIFLPMKHSTNRRDAKLYLSRLVKAGYAEAEGAAFRLLRKPKRAPRFRGSGAEFITKNQQMWNSMRQLDTFTKVELALFASLPEQKVNETTAQSYIKILFKAGYLQALSTQQGKPWVWRLKPGMNTGPDAPQVLRIKAVYDANQNRIIGGAEGVEVAA